MTHRVPLRLAALVAASLLAGGGTAAAQTGSISGSVTDAGLAPLAGVSIRVFTSSGIQSASTTTDGNGLYSVSALPPASYFVYAVASSGFFVNQVYNGRACPFTGQMTCITAGTPVVVSSGATTESINFVLQSGGTISGTVRDANGIPIAGIENLFVTSAGVLLALHTQSTDANGAYASPVLPPDIYRVRTINSSATAQYFHEAYDNLPCAPGCPLTIGTPVTVSAGMTTSGIDFNLDQAGAISGVVRDSGAVPLSGISVQVYTSAGVLLTSANSIATGAYTFGGLTAGTYFVRTSTTTLLNELYSELPCSTTCTVTTGTPVVVNSGTTTSGVDFTLTVGARISGTVRDTGGAPISGVSVQVNNSAGSFVGSTVTNASGVYTSTVLESGVYFLRTSTATHVNELYDGALCSPTCTVTTGTPVTVTAGSTTSGIDFSLSVGGRVTGVVTATGGAPLSGVSVDILTEAGVPVRVATTNNSGAYTGAGLVDGQYFVRTRNALGFIDEIHDNMPCVGCTVASGTALTLADGVTSTVNFTLDAGGRIQGVVTDASTGAPISGATVQFLNATGSALAATSTTSAAGVFASTGLPTGTYFARVSNTPPTSFYLGEVYENVSCLPSCNTILDGTSIPVTLGVTVSGIDFALELGGRISGTMTDVNGVPASSGTVVVFDSSGVSFSAEGNSSQPATGTYTTRALPAGTYFVSTRVLANGFVNELYDDITCVGCNPLTGNAVTVSAGQTTPGINFMLATGPRIGGLITGELAQPLAGVTVNIFNAGGILAASATTDIDGRYLSREGLIDGTYYVRVSNVLAYVNELFDDMSCAPMCIPTSGTPVVITGGTDAMNVDFALAQGGRIAGSVTDANTGAPLQGVTVQLYDSNGKLVLGAGASTSSTGAFLTLAGLLPGTYYAVTNNSLGYINQVRSSSSGIDCVGCDPAVTGAAINVTAGNTVSGIDFALTPGGRVDGTVTDGNGVPIKNVTVEVFASPWQLAAASGLTNQAGYFITRSGLPTGTDYRARTANNIGFVNEVFNDAPCTSSCLPQSGQAISITSPLITNDVNFALDLDGDGDADGLAGTIDRNRVTLVDESATSSNDFTDVAIGGTTAGSITDRAGWNVVVGDISPAGVQVSVLGGGSGPAVLATCHEGNAEDVHLDVAGEAATILCTSGSGSTTVRATAASPFVELRKTVGELTTVLDIPKNQTATLGSPAGTDSENTQPIRVRLINSAGEEVGSFNLDPGEAAEAVAVGPTIVVSVEGGSVDVTVGQETATVGTDEQHTFCPTGNCNPAPPLVSATAWIGLKNSDDQGTQFDLRAELRKNGVLLTSGETLCVTSVTRNATLAKEVTVTFAPYELGTMSPSDILSVTFMTRIGTTPEGAKCAGPGGSHSNATGLRLYYDAVSRPSRLGPTDTLFLHRSGGNLFMNITSPSTTTAQSQDSAGVNFNGGNPWKAIGTWVSVPSN